MPAKTAQSADTFDRPSQHDTAASWDAAMKFPAFMLVVLCGVLWFAADSHACQRVDRYVVVDLNNQTHRHVLDHVWDAIRKGERARLHIARGEADANREAAIRGVPTKPGFDRDEYPPAMSDEGGAGSSVRYVRSGENRSAGAVMGNQLEDFCNGQKFRFERRPR